MEPSYLQEKVDPSKNAKTFKHLFDPVPPLGAIGWVRHVFFLHAIYMHAVAAQICLKARSWNPGGDEQHVPHICDMILIPV